MTTPVPPHTSCTYQSYTYSMVFSVPDQPWPSLGILQQCLEKVRRRDCRVFSSLEAIQQHLGANVGDLILTFTVAEPVDSVIFVSAEGTILHQIRNWNVDRSMPGWCLLTGQVKSYFAGKMNPLAAALLKAYPWVTLPMIVGAPMRIMSSPALAVAISHAGGLGFIGCHPKTSEMGPDLEEASAAIAKLRSSTGAFQNLPADGPLPVGIGLLLWNDDIEMAMGLIAKYRPCAAWLYAPRNGQSDLDEWSRRVRGASPQTRVWIQIGTVGEAKELLRGTEKPDVVVVQGVEAGGHGRANDGMGLISLFPEVADVLAAAPSPIPLFAAGGIADGRGAAAALCLGATGVVLGTRFLAAKEARISPGYQREVVQASNGAVTTTKTLLYNHLRGTRDWPSEYNPRVIINRSYTEYQQGRPFEELKKDFDQALKEGDKGWGLEGRLPAYAGASIGLVHEVKDAASIVHEVQDEVQKRISHLAV